MSHLQAFALLALPSLFACAVGQPGTATQVPAQPQVQQESQPAAEQMQSPSRGNPIADVNGNGVDDMIDISDGTSLDEDLNGIPDEVEGKFLGPK